MALGITKKDNDDRDKMYEIIEEEVG